MKPLVVLLIAALLSAGIARLTTGEWHVTLAANIGMCVMLCFTALGHFKFSKGMIAMVPKPIPFKKTLVQLSGFAEIGLGFALLFPATRHAAAIALITLFCLLLPANIYAAMNRLNYETGETNGKGLSYLWFRIPLQAFFIAWIACFSL
jgi:uncharacterized membrane protein